MARTTPRPPGPSLYLLASRRAFDQIPHQVRLRPEDIACRDQYGSTVLHMLCRQPSDSVVLSTAIDAILEQDPTVVERANHQSWTPLHLACGKRDETQFKDALVQKLVGACPAALSKRLSPAMDEKTCLHMAIENGASYETLQIILKISPQLAMEPYYRQGPQSGERRTKFPLDMLWDMEKTKDEPDRAKMDLLLKAAMECDDTSLPRLPLFDSFTAVCSVPCPHDFAERVLLEANKEYGTRDAQGNLPLHYAVLGARDATYSGYIIRWMLEKYPGAVREPIGAGRGGLLPLQILLRDRSMTWDGGVKNLLCAAPETLCLADPRDGLIPVLSSAMNADKSPSHLSTTFELLRASPEVLRDGFFA